MHLRVATMDVYAEIRIRDKVHPVIFENKTNTYLHSKQLENYCDKVAGWMQKKSAIEKIAKRMGYTDLTLGSIHYVYIKTGYPFGWQKVELEKSKAAAREKVTNNSEKTHQIELSFRELYLEDLVFFVRKHRQKDSLLSDYCAVLENNLQKMQFAKTNLWQNAQSCANAMDDKIGSNEVGCSLLLEECFGQGIYFNYSHQNWASRDVITTHNAQDETIIYYGFKIENRSIASKRYAYVFRFYQYWDKKNSSKVEQNFQLERKTEAEKVRKLTEEIVLKLWPGLELEQLETEPTDMPSDKTLFILPIDAENTPKSICCFVRDFTEELYKRKEEICSSAVICDLWQTPHDRHTNS